MNRLRTIRRWIKSYQLTLINWIFLAGFSLLLAIIVFLFLLRSEAKVRERAGVLVGNSRDFAHEAVKSMWLERQTELSRKWASDTALIRYTGAFISASRQKLLNSKVQTEARDYIRKKVERHDITDITIISKDFINLTSFLDQRIGDTSLIVSNYKHRLQRVFEGQNLMIPPVKSDVLLPDGSGELVSELPCMFVCSPIRDFSGNVIAVLAIRYDPRRELALTSRMGFAGKSGETYMIDSLGMMISEGRFANELVARGLIEKGESTILNVKAVRSVQRKSGTNITGYRNYRGVKSLGAWLWDEEMGVGFIAEIDETEALAPYADTYEIAIGLTGVVTVLAFILLIGWRKITIDSWHKVEERRKAMEESLKRDRERLQSILESSPVGVALTVDNTLRSCNPRYTEMFGVSAGDYPVKTPPPPEVSNRILDLIERNELKNIDVQLTDAHGVPIDVLLTGYKTHFEGVTTLITWVIDITKQKQAARELALLNELVYGGLDSANIGAWWIDFSEDDAFHALDKTVDLLGIPVNSDGSKIYKTSRWNEIIAESTVKNKKSSLTAEEIGMRFLDAMTGRSMVVDVTYPIVRPDGSLKWINVRAYVPHRDEKGMAKLMVGTIIDVSAQKNAELEVYEAKEEAVQATKSKSEFLARMSHEIRTPMNAIIGITYLVLQSELNQKQRDNLKKVHESGLSLLGIINDILDFSKIEAGKLELEYVEFDLEKVFYELANIVTYKAHEKGLEVVFDLQQTLPPLLVGDPLRLKQILINLANNAIKFTAKGEIVVKAKKSKEEDGRICILFSIRDTGIGLTGDEMGRLFQSFAQADSSTTRKYGGTGLGLSIVKTLVEMLGGKVWIESTKGAGSTFFFSAWFDVNKDQNPRELKPPMDLRGMKVLVCDDNDTALDVIKEVLEGFTFRVKAVNSGEDAIAELEKNKKDPYQLLFMDWNMPVMDGVKTIEAIRSNSKINPPPLTIMLTAHNRQDVLMAAEAAGVNSFLVKPVGYSILFDTIMMLFDRESDRLPSHQPGRISGELLQKLEGALVLLVEDNEVNQDVAIGMLEECGVKAEIANNGQEAVEMVIASGVPSKYKVVIMDLRMPVMDGYEATRAIRMVSEYNPLPIVAMTADAISGIKEKCLEIGMNDFINKPIDPNQFYSTLAKWIGGNSSKQTTESPTDSIETYIPDIPGVNRKAREARFRSDASYLKFLRNFHKHFSAFLPVLKANLFAGDIEKSERMVHDLKGLSGMLDSESLHSFAITLDDKLKENVKVDIEEELSTLGKLLEPVLVSIKAIIERQDQVKQHDGRTEGVLDKSVALVTLGELKELLRQNDFDAVSKTKTLLNLDGISRFKEDLDAIFVMIGEYDFDEASAVVDKLIRRISNS